MHGTISYRAALALGVCWIAACSGDTSSTDGDRGAPVLGAGTGGGQAGAAGGTGASGTGSFGNPTQQPGTAGTGMLPMGGAGGEQGCEAGMFCEPDEPDPGNCGTIHFEPEVEVTRTPGNLLIVFDESGSMDQQWQGTGTSKREAARMALEAAIQPLVDDLTVGALFLPQRGCFTPFDPGFPGNAVDPLDAATQIAFRSGPDFLTAWSAHWSSFVGGALGTPLQEAFDKADVAIRAALDNQTITGRLAVVAFTDGEPNCVPDPTMYTTMPAETRAAEWLTLGIETHVVGLPGANGSTTLNAIAQSGGTMAYIDPANPMALQEALQKVVEETVTTGFNSCSMKLNPPPDLPDELLMIVDEPGVGTQQVPRDRGWEITVDGGEAVVDITGGLCDAAMTGRFSSITFEYACPEAPPPPVLPPVE